jgi:hypothetical protein
VKGENAAMVLERGGCEMVGCSSTPHPISKYPISVNKILLSGSSVARGNLVIWSAGVFPSN